MSPLAFPTETLRASDGACVEICTHGAHVCAWQPARGGERLYLSRRSRIDGGAAIRGGVPVIFPQFAAEGPLPKHGFARSRPWIGAGHGLRDDGRAYAAYTLRDDAATRAIWPHDFQAELNIEVGGDALDIELSVVNLGAEVCHFSAALHTYLRVSDIAAARVVGLQGVRYRDSAAGEPPGTPARHLETAEALPIEGEVDRIYCHAPPQIELRDGDTRLVVQSRNFPDLVVWNPGEAKAAALADLDPGGWRQMLCLEAATIATPVRLAPGARWRAAQRLVAA
ncbi:D-hexose-6-phosphate mutarotase [Solimonas soli]|uniref:D-hexose-6-phosphate mutarotase n=1 Tax=Solimonas soli TaxID=413479 RepID=UPI00048245FD|nr:D-hexose-6-phosphate mutarotase [Solimonas soli]